MNEREFLNVVLQGAGRGSFAEGYDSGAAWEISAQVVIAAFLKAGYGITNCRELKYDGSKEHCDFGYTLDGKTYAVELKVESRDGKFAGAPLQLAITMDVGKLHAFDADYKWFLVIARSAEAKSMLSELVLRGDSWSVDEESDFLAAICDINSLPHGLPWVRMSKDALAADRKALPSGTFLY